MLLNPETIRFYSDTRLAGLDIIGKWIMGRWEDQKQLQEKAMPFFALRWDKIALFQEINLVKSTS